VDLHSHSRFIGAIATAAVLWGCGPKNIDYQVKVVTNTCDPSSNPFDGAQFVQVRVTGTGIDMPLTKTSMSGDGMLELPDIPVGPKRTIEVRAYADDPSAGAAKPISVGKSLPFDVPDMIDPTMTTVQVSVFLRKVDTFTPPSPATAPSTCSQMRTARAGHTATLLPDGRVFIAGGFQLMGTQKSALASAEIYDPGTGAFEDAPAMPAAKAFHVAVMLNSGEVFLQGGEVYSGSTTTATTSALFFDPPSRKYGSRSMRRDGTTIFARTQHVALFDQSGKVLLAGGLGMGLTPLPQVEWYDPMVDDVKVATGQDLSFPAAVAGAALQGGKQLAVIGGANAGGLETNQATIFSWSDAAGMFVQDNPVTLTHTRRAAAAAARPDGSVAVLAGADTPTSELIDGTISQAGPDVGQRASICAVTLPDGTVLAIGGRSGTTPHSDPSATIVSFGSAPAATPAAPLKVPRWAHTCTLLADGTVLVTGGIDDTSGTKVLQDAYIYTPAPAD
jgi:hypothetical protein